MSSEALLQLHDLHVHFPVKRSAYSRSTEALRAVAGVSLSVPAGTTLGLVGESGCGKSTLGRAVVQLERPTAGRIVFQGQDLTGMWRRGFFGDRFAPATKVLRQRLQMVFQDPYSSLNPRMTVLDLVGEPLTGFGLASGRARRERVAALLERVGLDTQALQRYPHEFSGGQRQRIGIARAIAAEPALLVCDEPTSALDVSVRAQILNLLRELQQDRGYTYVFIAHDLSAVRHMAKQLAVMYLGKLVEVGPAQVVCAQPRHPYTQALVAAVPVADPAVERVRKHLPLSGELPSPLNPPSGCAFHTRCPRAEARCRQETPELRPVAQGVEAACHFA